MRMKVTFTVVCFTTAKVTFIGVGNLCHICTLKERPLPGKVRNKLTSGTASTCPSTRVFTTAGTSGGLGIAARPCLSPSSAWMVQAVLCPCFISTMSSNNHLVGLSFSAKRSGTLRFRKLSHHCRWSSSNTVEWSVNFPMSFFSKSSFSSEGLM